MTRQLKAGIIYQGPSQIDGLPIVAIATYSDRNTKTGKVLQTYIIRSDMSPLEASKSGQDFSICANCIFRGIANNDPERKQAKIVSATLTWDKVPRLFINLLIVAFIQ